jgi:bifunctional non-homologous end joining protein LigD
MLWDEAHRYSKQLAQKFADRDRARYTLSAALAARPGHLFIDYLRNGRGTTAIGAYSPRARPRFPIAAPVSWADVGQETRPDTFTMDESLPVNARASRRASVQRSKGRQQKTE